MHGMTLSPNLSPKRVRKLGLALATAVLLTVWAPSAANASGCTDSWTNTAGGSWFTPGNWSTKAVPTSADEACITVAGTYTVEMAQTNITGSVSVKALTVGGSSGTQALILASTPSANASLTTSAGLTTTAHGAVTITPGETNANNLTLTGPVANAGTLTVEMGKGGGRALTGSFTNTGTLAINSPTAFNGASALLSNEGALNVASGVQLIASNNSQVTNAAGGKIAGAGTGDVLIEPGSAYNQGAGTTSGTKPVIVRDATVNYTGAGASTVTVHGESSGMSGNIVAGQTLMLESTSSENVHETAGASFSNAGTITLTNGEGNANNVSFTLSAGTLSNSGSLNVEKASGGGRTIQGSITNTGTIAIHATTAYNGAKALLTNQAALSLATSAALVVSNEGAVTNSSGATIAATGSGAVDIEPGATFTEGLGTTSGTKPVVVRDAALHYTGSGASSIAAVGESVTLSGNIAAGQALTIESTAGENSGVSASASFSNAGTITLTNAPGNANNVSFTLSAGVLSNSGTIIVEKGSGGGRTIQGNLTNTGTLAINGNTAYNATEKTLLNEGAVNIATAVTLAVSGSSTVTNAGGLIAGTGTGALVESTGTFNQGLGKTTTAKTSEPVILDRVALHFTDKGTSKIALRGASALSGTINKGQTLTLQSTCGENAEVAATGSFLNSGTINMTNVDSCADNVRLSLAGGTLENKGTINVLFPHGGGRLIEGSLTNEKTLAIGNDPSQSLKVSASFSQRAKATLKDTIAGSTNFSRLTVGGSAVLNGKLSLKQLKFTGKAGESFAILSDASRTGEFTSVSGNAVKGGALHYVPHYTPTGVNLIVE